MLIMCLVALMQIPACLIAGEQYSLWVLWTELVTVLGFSLFTMVILFLCPSHKMMLGLPLWSGFCGGIAGGILGDMNDMTEDIDVFWSFAAIAIVGSVAFILAVLYRYIKTVCEERRGLPKKSVAGEE